MPSLTMGTLNVRGSEGEAGLRRFLHRFRVNTKTKQKLGVMCIQEHMLPKSKHDSHMQLIKMKDFDAVISYGRHDDPASARGGTAIIWDTKAVEYKRTLDNIPGYVRIVLEWGGSEIEVASAYAPSASGLARVDLFNETDDKISF